MKNKIVLMLFASTVLMACNQKKTEPTTETIAVDSMATDTDNVAVDMHNAQNSLDWAGT